MQKILVWLFACCFAACSSNTSNQTLADSGAKPMTDSNAAVSFDSIKPLLSCYAYTQNEDTIRVKIATGNHTFIGHLSYHLKEKDHNDGTLNGTIKGDTLIADYTFSSEGKLSVRQVAFLKQGSNLKEGFGEVKEENGTMIFTNPHALEFTGFLLMPTACE